MGEEQSLLVKTRQQQQMGLELSTHLVKQVVEKNYLTTLRKLTPISFEKSDYAGVLMNVRMYKIEEIVYTANENISQKLTSVFNALAVHKSSVFLLIDAETDHVNLYLGVRQVDQQNSVVTTAEALRKAIHGQFPGTKLTNVINPKIREIQNRLAQYQSIAIASGIPELKNKAVSENEQFVQGIEKFINTMQGELYQCVILAENLTKDEVVETRTQYENVYSRLSAVKKLTVNIGDGRSTGISSGTTTGTSEGLSDSTSQSYSLSESAGITASKSLSRPTDEAVKAAKKVAAVKVVSQALDATVSMVTDVNAPVFQMATNILSSSDDMKSRETQSESQGTSQSQSTSKSDSHSTGTTHATSTSDSKTRSINQSTNRSTTQEFENKTITNMLKRLDQQFERIDDFSDTSAWKTAAYFLSDQPDAAEIAGATYQSIMSGENTGIQVSAVNVWHADANVDSDASLMEKRVKDYVVNFLHPEFIFNDITNMPMVVDPTSTISSEELGLALSLPRQSISGVPVIEQVRFAKSIATYQKKNKDQQIQLGKIAPGRPENPRDFEPNVSIDIPSLSSHVFITGSTGTGKSNTVYAVLGQLLEKHIKFCVIEPAKGEYKNVFGNRDDVNVYGTNPKYTPLLRINPFAFPKGVHVFEHIDRLIEIFNVSWPMYAAMPAILKDAVIMAYEHAGWDLKTSVNPYGNNLFPDFSDLISCLKETIAASDYSAENKGNYTGSLVTRVRSLTNGLNGMILTGHEIPLEQLFDENTIIDLSRVGSTETKSLLMGILIMRLNEYRMDTADGMNSPLKHVTVLEEAHNILGSASDSGPEGAGMQQKSVQLLTSAIAEMRTFGEGFMIVDQSPSSVDIAAIKNTNTKIIMRMPEENDRNLVGKAAALSDEQLAELALLHKGEAVVYQNDWLEPALVNIRSARELIDVDGTYQYKQVTDVKSPEISTAEVAEVGKIMVYRLVRDPLPYSQEILQSLMENDYLTASEKVYLSKLHLANQEKLPDVDIRLDFLAKIIGIEDLSSCRGKVKQLYRSVYSKCRNRRLTSQLLALIDRYLENGK
ncbi:ATP-binding protein [Levilactobacillus sp. N40-8-2]|uniref:ATP-binding protein n=1 Tax=Levilactobacillus muriae TaxID=3238987 RepID=UPI0038B31F05